MNILKFRTNFQSNPSIYNYKLSRNSRIAKKYIYKRARIICNSPRRPTLNTSRLVNFFDNRIEVTPCVLGPGHTFFLGCRS